MDVLQPFLLFFVALFPTVSPAGTIRVVRYADPRTTALFIDSKIPGKGHCIETEEEEHWLRGRPPAEPAALVQWHFGAESPLPLLAEKDPNMRLRRIIEQKLDATQASVSTLRTTR
jgi:hypothetical protein